MGLDMRATGGLEEKQVKAERSEGESVVESTAYEILDERTSTDGRKDS
jgi:hypothetical protein